MNSIFRKIEGMSIGELIKLFREYKGYSQEELAGAIGVSAATVSNYEHNKTIPDVLTLRSIILFLHIPTEYIFLRDGGDVRFVLYHMEENIIFNEFGMPITDNRSEIYSKDLNMYAGSKWNFCCFEVLGKVYLVCDYNEDFEDGIVIAREDGTNFYRLMNKCGMEFTDVLTDNKCRNVVSIAGRVLGEISEYKIKPSI